MVVSIWKQVAAKVPQLNFQAGQERREDFSHPDWDDPKPTVLNLEEDLPNGSGAGPESPKGASPPSASQSAPHSCWELVGERDSAPDPKVLFPHDELGG